MYLLKACAAAHMNQIKALILFYVIQSLINQTMLNNTKILFSRTLCLIKLKFVTFINCFSSLCVIYSNCVFLLTNTNTTVSSPLHLLNIVNNSIYMPKKASSSTSMDDILSKNIQCSQQKENQHTGLQHIYVCIYTRKLNKVDHSNF